jgi:hypothetical protein
MYSEQGEFAEHDGMRAPEAGVAGKKMASFFSLAESAGVDVFLIVRAKSGRIQDLLAHVGAGRGIIQSIQWGEVVRVGA